MHRLLQVALILSFLLSAQLGRTAEDVRVQRDVPYLGPDRKEKMDLYLPAKFEQGKKYPAVVIIHGGGWTGGDKGANREQNIGTNLVRAGYVCASINYLLGEKQEDNFAEHLAPVWPQNLYDCKNAVRFLRKNAEQYQIDADHIGAIGGSAGGHLTAMLGLTGPDAGLDPPGEDSNISCQVQAIVPMYGAHDLTHRAKVRNLYDQMTPEQRELCVNASPVTYVTKDDPPALILHGTADKLVPVKQSELLHEALQKGNVSSELVIIKDAPHTFHLQPKQRDLRPLVIGFFDKHLKK